LLVLALLGATAAAFAVTERLKLERSPITGTQVDRVFSPVCECARDVAVISLILRRRETVTLDMLNNNGCSILSIVRKMREPAGRVSVPDGRDVTCRPRGVYRPRVQLERNGGRSSCRTRSASIRQRRVSRLSAWCGVCSLPTPTATGTA
jgi:hypothetical protein